MPKNKQQAQRPATTKWEAVPPSSSVTLAPEAKDQADQIVAEERLATPSVPIAERLAYVLREWVHSHSQWSKQMVNGSHLDDDGNEYPQVETPCECSHCRDARVVLEDYGQGRRR